MTKRKISLQTITAQNYADELQQCHQVFLPLCPSHVYCNFLYRAIVWLLFVLIIVTLCYMVCLIKALTDYKEL